MNLDPWAVTGTAAAVAAIIVSIIIGVRAHRSQFPKRELRYEIEVFPLLHDSYGHPSSGLEVSLHGKPLLDAHVVSIRIRSVSRADIASSAFDNGDSIRFASSTPIVATGWTGRGEETIGFEVDFDQDGASSHVNRVPAQLIRRNATGVMTGITEGEPNISVISPLVDVALKDGSSRKKRGSMWGLRLDDPNHVLIVLTTIGAVGIILLTVSALVSG